MPPTPLDLIETIVVVVMENRSFDHMLSYLSLKQFGGRTDVEGIRDDQDWLQSVANLNPFDGLKYQPLPLTYMQTPDQPHERVNIAQQLGKRRPDGSYPMDGFIASAGGNSQVMQYYTPREIPITDFFLRLLEAANKSGPRVRTDSLLERRGKRSATPQLLPRLGLIRQYTMGFEPPVPSD